MTSFGLTSQGYTPMRLADWQTYLNQQFTAAFGSNVNLDPRSNMGQLIGILAERYAYLDELVEAVYQASYPAGAEGIGVDNILALSGLSRLAAMPPKTQPTPVVQTNGITLYGLVLYGTAGTTVPAGSLVADTASPAHVFSLDNSVTIAPAVNSQQTIVISNVPTSGAAALSVTAPSGSVLTTPAMSYQALAQQTLLLWPTPPSSGSWSLTFGATPTASLPYNATAAAVAAAINAVLGITTVTVNGSIASGMVISWPAAPIYFITASSDPSAPTVINPVQAAISSLYDGANGTFPFQDVTVTGSGTVYSINFGAYSLGTGQATSAATPIPLITVASNTLQSGSTAVNLAITEGQQGAPAQGLGTATGTVAGAATVKAGTITVIQTPVAGWSGVVNQLDCIAGSNTETDEDALVRRGNRLQNQALGPLSAILARVQAVSGVTQALAFANTTNAALQSLTFAQTPSSGSFQLATGGATTPALPYNATAGQIQTALQAISGYSPTLVTGSSTYGFQVDFNGSLGGQAVPLLLVVNNTTGVAIKAAYGRYPKSIEVVAAGGANTDIANAIYQTCPTGIATYGAPVLQTTVSVTAGSSTAVAATSAGLTLGLSLGCLGVTPGTYITAISGSSVTLSAPALSTYSNTAATFSNATAVTDSNSNPVLIGFSRPQAIPVFVVCQLVTDTYLTPGNPSSGANIGAKWSSALVPQVQAALLAIGNQIPIGGTITGFGTNGLVGAFNQIPGIVSYSLTFGVAPNPTNTANISLLSEQVPYFTQQNITVSYT